MPRGDNPNSRKNLTHPGFNSESAREAAKKSNATKKYQASFRAAGKDLLTDERMQKMWDSMIKRAEAGNITAFKMLFDVMGEAAYDFLKSDSEVRLAYIVPQDEPEQPPEVIEEEADE